MARGEVLGDPKFEALRRETALVAEHLGIGATAIGRAGHERTAMYAQAFFALSVGFERGAKIALTIESALSNDGRFLTGRELRAYGHDLTKLLADVATVAQARGCSDPVLPDGEIHRGIVATLTNFASNVSRYYNLEVLTESAQGAEDPIVEWHNEVTRLVVATHYTEQRRQADYARAAEIVIPADMYVSVAATTETREPIRALPRLASIVAEERAARPWERMYVLQLARFLTAVIGELGTLAQAEGLPVPYLDEYFYDFQLDDAVFRRRKTWLVEGGRGY